MTLRIVRGRRRGAAAVAMIATLVILQVVVIVTVVAGARDQDMTVQRMDSARAMYAAEAGMNMAVKELMSGSDADADGSTGGISNDGNSANDPTIGGGRVVATVAVSGTQYTVTSTGRSGSALRKLTTLVTIQAGFDRRLSYCQWSNQIPLYRTWNGTTWSAASNTLDFGAKQYWSVIRKCPTRSEALIACSLQVNDFRAAVQTGSTWGNLVQLTPDCGSITSRVFYAAYEQLSGKGIVVYRSGNSPTLNYRTWNGTAWSSQSTVTSPLTGNPTWIKLIPKAGSNEMMLLVLDSNNDIAAMVWDGSAFGNKVTLETSAATSVNECIDAAYEAGTGRAVVVWGKAATNNPQYRIWTGSAWLTASAATSVGAVPQWVHLAADPASSKLLLGVLDDSSKINVCFWDGSFWGTTLQVEPNAAVLNSRCFDVAFEGGGTRAMVMYSHTSTLPPRYRVWDGTSWGSQTSGPSLPSVPLLVQLTPSSSGHEIMALINVTGGQNKLEFMRWDGTALGSLQELESNVSGASGAEIFMVTDEPSGTATSIRTLQSWTDASPQ